MDRPDPPVPLIGRTPELEVIDGELRHVAEGRFRFILIDGAAGVGKSRLMSEVVGRHRTDMRALSARSYQLGVTTSFGPWLEALDRHALSTGDSRVREQIGVTGADLNRELLLDQMTSTFARWSDESPVLVAIDDMHLADASSWEALRFFARRLWNRPVAVLATARSGGLRSRPLVGDVLHALGDDQALRRVNVRPFNPDEVAELARARLRDHPIRGTPVIPRSLVDWLVERSLGHPLFALGLIDALIEQGADVAAPDLAETPVSLRERVRLELSTLPSESRQVLELLSVLDQRTDPADVAEVMGWEMGEVGRILEGLHVSSLVREEATGHGFIYEIAHPLIQETIYELVGGARRMALHRAVARVLRDRGRIGSAAAHFARSSLEADDEVLDAVCHAISEAESNGLYREALEILGGLPDIIGPGDPRWLKVLEAITWQADWVVDHLAEGDAEGAIVAMRRIEEVTRNRRDLAAQGTIQFHLASFLSIGAGRLDEAASACQRAIELFDTAGEKGRSLLARNEMVWISSCIGHLERSHALAGEVLDQAEGTADPLVINQAAGSRAYVLGLMGRFAESELHYDTAERIAVGKGLTYRRIWGLTQLSHAVALSGRLSESVDALERALATDYTLACDALALERLAYTRWLQGNLSECVRLVDESGARRAFRGSRRRAWALAVAARALGELGQISRAERRLAQARETYGGEEILDWSAWCHWAGGYLSLLRGDPSEALEHYRRAEERYRDMGALAPEGLVLVDVTEAALEADEHDVLAYVATRLREIADAVEGDLHPILAGIGEAVLALARSRMHVEPALSAIERLEEKGYRLLAQTAAYVAGMSLFRSGDARAAEILEKSARLADECGAVWRRDKALELLSELGSAGRRAAGSILGPQSLTPREREVAELAARGFTAPQIAERLYIGTRTVESHLANIYPKLGVTSKQELALKASDLG